MELTPLPVKVVSRTTTTTRDGVLYEGLPPEPGIPANWTGAGEVQVSLRSACQQGAEAAAVVAAAARVPAHLTCSEARSDAAAEQAATFLRMAAWLALLFAGFGVQRGLCAGGLPYDCEAMDAAEVYEALTALAFAGGALGWLADVFRSVRFAWLAAPCHAYLWLAYAGLLPAYSVTSNLPALRGSLSSAGMAATPAMVAMLALAGTAVLAAVVFHFWLAVQDSSSIAAEEVADDEAAMEAAESVSPRGCSIFCWRGTRGTGGSVHSSDSNGQSSSTSAKPSSSRRLRWCRRRLHWRRLGLYLLPRVAVLMYFIVWFAALPASGSFELHLHHYALGWAVASLAAFNHPVSGLLLALGTAVFVQGVGSYGLDPFFKLATRPPGGCLPVASNQTGQMVCAFWAAAQFDLRFCSDTPWIPWFDCTVPWPWTETALASVSASTSHAAHTRPQPAPASSALAPAPLPIAPAPEPLL